jgi:hypothetical protein
MDGMKKGTILRVLAYTAAAMAGIAIAYFRKPRWSWKIIGLDAIFFAVGAALYTVFFKKSREADYSKWDETSN